MKFVLVDWKTSTNPRLNRLSINTLLFEEKYWFIMFFSKKLYFYFIIVEKY